MIFRQLFYLILFCHFSSYCFSLTTEMNCEKQEKYIETTTVERYTWKEVNVTVLITEFCRGIPFPIGPKCSKVVLKTVLKRYPAVDVIQITKIRTIRACCAGYDEIPLINQCQPICETSCQNGGECVAPNTCNCTQQFIGDSCEQDFNECASNFDNCEHTCTNLFGSYKCGCQIGYYLSTDGYSCPENTVRITDLIINSQNGITVRLDWSLQFAHEFIDLVECENPIKTIVINSYKNNSETILDSIMVAINETNLTLASLDFNTTYIFELQVISVLDIITFRKVSYTTSPQDFLCINYKMHNSINPCGIGGVCLDAAGDSSQYICECKPGYNGINCKHDIDECLDQICYNGGTCIDGINEYFCLCASSYEGIDCSTLKPICDSNPCFNNGNCTSALINSTHQIYSCDCPLGFTGDHCQFVDYCSEVNCRNGAQCSSLGDKFVCNCTPNYSGLYCESIINPCYDDPCINGECHIMSVTNQAYCACSRFHYGSRCQHTCIDSYGSPCVCDSINSCKNYCENETDAVYGIEWANFPINSTSLVSCSVLNTSYSGFISRKCDQFGDWQLINTTDCVYIPDPEFNCAFTKSLSKLLLNYTTDLVLSKSDNMTLNAVLLSLLTSTSTIANLSVELRCSSTIHKQIIQIFSNILQSSIQMETINDIENLLSSLEQSISPFIGIYNTINTDGLLLEGEYIDYVSTIISTARRREEELEVIRIDLPQSSIHIPQHYVRIPLSLISQLDLEGNRVDMAVIKTSQAMRIDIISINISSSQNSDRFHNFLPPITLTFYAKTAIPADMTCVFLNTKGEWVNEGVTTSLLTKESVTCEVSHLGSFTAIPFDQVAATSVVVFNSTTIQQPHSINQTNSPNTDDSEIANVLFIIEVILFILSFTIICVLAITFVLHSFFRLSNKEKRNTFKKTYLFYIVLLHFSVANTCVLILLNINIILDIVFIRNAIVCMTIQSLIYFILLVSISYDLVSTIHCLICLILSNTQKIFNHPMLNFLTLTLISLGISITLFVPLIGGLSSTYFQEFNRIQPLRCSHFISKELFLGFSSLCSLLLLVNLAAVISCIILYKKNHTAIESKRIKYIKLILFYSIMIPSKIVYFLLLSLIIATLSDVKYGCTVFYSLILTMIIYMLSMYILTDKLIKNNTLITPKMKIPQHHEPHFNTYNKNKREYSVDCIDDSSLPNITVLPLSNSNSMQMNEPEFENQINDTLYSSNCYIIPLDNHLQLRNLSHNQIIDPPAYQDIEMTNNSSYDMVGELSPISLTQYDTEYEIHGKQIRGNRSGEYGYTYEAEYCKDDFNHFNKENNIRSNSCSDLNLIKKIKPINPNETPFVIQKYMRLDSVSSEHIYFQSMPDLSEKIKDSVFRKSTGEITFSSEKIFKIDKKDNQKQENSFQTIREKYDNVL